MIQRKQSLWLLVAALLNAGVFIFDLYRADVTVNGIADHKVLRVADHYPPLLIALVMTLLPVVTIFMFSNRKRQVGMSAVSMVGTLSFISMMLMRVKNISPAPAAGSYWIGAVLPVAAVIFIVMAIVGIRKDEKLVRSVDRLR